MTVEHARAMARAERGGALAAASPTAAIDAFKILDVYAGGVSREAPRVEALATISAGYRGPARGDRLGLPQRSTDGTIILHDGANRAPGLARALERADGKLLTIAFPFDDPAKFIHCRFMEYSATELLAFGDEAHLMVLDPGRGYRRVGAGTPEYDERMKSSKIKVGVSVYFCLAEWGRDGPEIVFPDGVGAFYRLRFTSRHSLRSILAGLRAIAQFTQGRIAGVPFDLAIDYREVAGADGKKRRIPVWSIATRPPGGRRLTSRNFNEVMTMALEQGAALMLALPAPPEPTLEEALAEGPDDDLDDAIIDGVVVGEPSDREVELIQRGGRCNEASWRAMFFSAVRSSEFDGDESPARAAWMREYTHGRTESLADFLHWATEREAQAMVVAASDELNRRRAERDARGEPSPQRGPGGPRPARTYDELFAEDDGAPPWVATYEDQWARGTARARGIGAEIPDKPDPSTDGRDACQAVLRQLAANIQAREQSLAERPDPRPDTETTGRDLSGVSDDELDARLARGTEKVLGRPPRPDRGSARASLVAELLGLVKRARDAGGSIDVPDDLDELDDEAVVEMVRGVRDALDRAGAAPDGES
jgi:hypothetical protein